MANEKVMKHLKELKQETNEMLKQCKEDLVLFKKRGDFLSIEKLNRFLELKEKEKTALEMLMTLLEKIEKKVKDISDSLLTLELISFCNKRTQVFREIENYHQEIIERLEDELLQQTNDRVVH